MKLSITYSFGKLNKLQEIATLFTFSENILLERLTGKKCENFLNRIFSNYFPRFFRGVFKTMSNI